MRTAVIALVAALTVSAADSVDLAVVNRIKAEEFQNSKVMEILQNLSDRYGPRLTGSPEFKEAADWALKRLQEYGLENAHLEKWGPFGRSWTLEKFAVEMTQPRYSLLNAWPLAWSQNTKGAVSGEPILATMPATFRPKKGADDLEKYIEKWKGKLKGKIILISEPINNIVESESKPAFRRYTDAELQDLAVAPAPVEKMKIDMTNLDVPDDADQRMRFFTSMSPAMIDAFMDQREELSAKRAQFLLAEGVAAVIEDDRRARDGMVFAEAAGPHNPKSQLAPATFVVTSEQYNRIARLIGDKPGDKAKVELAVNLKTHASDAPVDAYNLIAEIPGSSKKDEIVMLGAHFDSWHSGTGATDNGAGSAVMLEVVRILKALDLKMDRTVRIALWSGEEQGLLGSKAYVKEHFGDPKTMKLTSAHATLSGYFNLDNGSGKIRGVYLQDHDAMRPIFADWLAPFRDLGVSTITIRNTGGTDHQSFDALGLPGFQFIQDPLDYSTVAHHSSMDVYDHAIAGDLMQCSAVIASVVYDAATRKEMLPRKPLPKPGESSPAATK
ncbi:MAG TPA: M20/M25/M40 family metallo-hydrolase [Bryobacteraceae bacterium]|jgi:carboxypeptidase Q|nr:M20/M25/M40 family metallo-hydrolase [Bryobacteraceae bacterium]